MTNKKQSILSLKYLMILLVLLSPVSLMAQFSGVYMPDNWTFISQDLSEVPADGSIDLSNMPTGFTIVGNDDDLTGANSLYSITVPEDGTIKFRWVYGTDDGPEYDRAGYILNGTFTELTDPDGNSDQNGEQAVTVMLGDEFAFAVDASDACCGRGWLTIEAFSTADNTPPTMDGLSNVFEDVNPGQIDVNLIGITAGILESSQSIVITATSSNTAVIPDPIITYTSPNATGTLSFTPVTDAYGDATITVNIMDDGETPNGSVDNIDVTFEVTITSNFPPEINSIADLEGQINEAINIGLSGISAGTGETQTMTITATSSNEAVIANIGLAVTYTSPNTTGSLNITPVINASGETIISLTVTDDGGASDNGKNETIISFKVIVNPNGQPTINEIVDLNLYVNDGEQIVNLDGLGDGDSDVSQTLTLTVTSDNTSVIPDPTVTYTSPNATGMLTFTPLTDQFGTATITVSLSDNGGTNNGGLDETSFSFVVNVFGNFPPEIDAIGNIVMGINEPNRTVNLAGISGGIISNAEDLTITAETGNSSIVAQSDIQVNYTSPNATGDLILKPGTDAIGESTVTVTVSDNGGTDNGGIDATEESFVVRVIANRAPEVDQASNIALDINALEQTVNLTGISSGEDSDYQTISITASSDNNVLIPNPTVTYISPNGTGSIAFTPVTDEVGVANITVTVTDDGGILGGGVNSTTMIFEVSVTGNQPPTLDVIDDVSQNSVSDFSVNLSGISDGTGFTQNLVLDAISDNPTIIPNPTINYTNGQATGSLDFVPTDFGDATITVTLTDDGGLDNGGVDTFVLTFNIHIGENTPPDFQDYNSGDDLDGQVFYFNNGQGDQAILFSPSDVDHNITSVTAISDNSELEDILFINYIPGNFIGGLIFSPVSGQTGIANFEVSVMDDGGTANNGIDTSVSTITAVVTEPTPYSDLLSSDAFEHHIQAFTVDQAGLVYINNLSGNITAFFSLYENSFDPLNPGNNQISTGTELTPTLEKDTQYILVTTNSSGGTGSFTNSIGVLNGNVGFGFLPNLNFVENLSQDEDNASNVALSGISDGNGNTNNLTLSAVADVSTAFSSLTITDNLDGTANLMIAPSTNYYGTNSITVTVIGENGNTFDRSFTVTVNPINDPPIVVNPIGNQAFENAFGTAQFDLSIVFSDVEGDVLSYNVSAEISGVVDVSEAGGILTLTEQGPGTVNITVGANDGLGGEVSEVFEVVIESVTSADFPNREDVKIYPNPATNTLIIEGGEKLMSFEIYNTNGLSVLKNENYKSGSLINVGHFQAGLFTIVIKNNEQSTHAKFIKH